MWWLVFTYQREPLGNILLWMLPRYKINLQDFLEAVPSGQRLERLRDASATACGKPSCCRYTSISGHVHQLAGALAWNQWDALRTISHPSSLTSCCKSVPSLLQQKAFLLVWKRHWATFRHQYVSSSSPQFINFLETNLTFAKLV